MGISVMEAYDIVEKLPDRNVLLSCVEYENEWEFIFIDVPLSFYGGTGVEGGLNDVVNKRTGKFSRVGTDAPSILARMKRPQKSVDVTQFPKGVKD